MKNLYPETEIFFAEKLSHRITPLLEKMGFYLEDPQFGNSEESFEALVYKRPTSDFDKPDEVSFYGDYSIKGEAYSKGVILPNIRELLSDYWINIPESHCWYYQDVESLEVCIEDVAKFIETILPTWFDALDPNPAQLLRSPIQLSIQEMDSFLRSKINILVNAITFARPRGHNDVVDLFKRQIQTLKNVLADLEQNK